MVAVAVVEGRKLRLGRGDLGREDERAREIERQRRGGGVGGELHGQRVHGLCRGDPAHVGLEAAVGACRGRDALDGGDHVLGVEVRAVVEFHAFAQLEDPRRFAGGFPRGGEAGNELEVVVAAGQRLEDVLHRGDVDTDRRVMRVHRFSVRPDPDGQILGKRRTGRKYQRGRTEQNVFVCWHGLPFMVSHDRTEATQDRVRTLRAGLRRCTVCARAVLTNASSGPKWFSADHRRKNLV